MPRFWPAACAALLFAGCATSPLSREPLAASAQEALLRELPGFRFDGRAAARVREDGSAPANLSWIQQGTESRLQLTGLLGTGGLTLVFSPGSLLVSNGRGESFRDGEAEQVIAAQLGFVPPFDALRFWALGLAAQGEPPASQQVGPAGRIAEMTQQGWRIQYRRWAAVATRDGEMQLPQRLTASRDDLRLDLYVNRWKLQAD
jgi:outer membrane lipoprotein LolB